MSSIAWENYHRRARALRAAVNRLEENRGVELPYDDDAVAAAFADRADLLVALHALWTRRLHARVELAMELDERSPEESVAAAWHEVASEMPEVRRVLDRHHDDPALRASQQHGYRLLAVAAGLAALGDPQAHRAAVGERLVERLRTSAAQDERRLTDRVADLVRRVPMPIVGARLGA